MEGSNTAGADIVFVNASRKVVFAFAVVVKVVSLVAFRAFSIGVTDAASFFLVATAVGSNILVLSAGSANGDSRG